MPKFQCLLHVLMISYLYPDLIRFRSSNVTTNPFLRLLEHEERLILESGDIDEYYVYNPTFEWPGEDESDASLKFGTSPSILIEGQPILRLVVLSSSILLNERKVAILDPYHEAQLGRDVQPTGSVIPRIRLKEMEVSKLHATVYWDGSRKEWNVVDMGSKHGTFLQSGTTSDLQAIGLRLSQPRFASVPRRLRHGDRLSIGSTTFAVHIHENHMPCHDCTVSDTFEIPLYPAVQKRTTDVGLDPESAGQLQVPPSKKDPKRVMNQLKRRLLKLHDEPQNVISGATGTDNYYVDRAARRRMLYVTSHSESPGVPVISPITCAKDTHGRSGGSTPEQSSQPAAPINPSNIGHRLLVQQGWTPGTALGNPSEFSDGLIEPLEVRMKRNTAGLGSKI